MTLGAIQDWIVLVLSCHGGVGGMPAAMLGEGSGPRTGATSWQPAPTQQQGDPAISEADPLA